MLTSELIRPRLRIHGSNLRVEMVHEQDPALQQIAQDLICLFHRHQGQSQAAWEQAVRVYEGTNVDYVFIRGLAKVLADAATPLARIEVIGARHPTPGLRPTWGKGRHPLEPQAALPERVDVVIVGGGIMGLALAWNLAGLGAGRILVLERGYLCEGASGRNGGGVRAQWTTPTLIELAKESIDFMGRFAQELGINVWLRKGGYLFLAHDEATLRRIEYGAELQKRHGLPTRVIGPGEAGEIVPHLDISKFIAASWNPEDGVVFPWPFLWGYADGARKRGGIGVGKQRRDPTDGERRGAEHRQRESKRG